MNIHFVELLQSPENSWYFVAAKLFHSSHMLRIPSLAPIRNLPSFSSMMTTRRLAASHCPRSTDGVDTSTLSPTFEGGSMRLSLIIVRLTFYFELLCCVV
uniref:Uncharacterized protein n=1 Tax=Schizaphis graminum TaxID=13262 RepID=A0A2S2NF04_SCHGA